VSSTDAVILLVLILPGFIALRFMLFSASNPPLGQWRETLWSLPLSALAYAVAAAMPRSDPTGLLGLLTEASAGADRLAAPQVVRAIAFAFWAALAIGCVLYLLFKWETFLRVYSEATARTITEAAWNNIFRLMEQHRVMVEVHRTDGQAFVGYADIAGTQPEDRSIVLSDAVRTVNANQHRIAEALPPRSLLYVPGESVASLVVLQAQRRQPKVIWWLSRLVPAGAVLALLALAINGFVAP